MAFHARPRATKDLDLLLEGSAENLHRAARALARYGAPANVVSATQSLQDSEVVYFGSPPLRVDLLRSIEGVAAHTVFARSVLGHWGDLEIRVIGIDDLIANKRAAGRPQDLADVQILERVRSRTRP